MAKSCLTTICPMAPKPPVSAKTPLVLDGHFEEEIEDEYANFGIVSS
jgi:hypothetical protein